MSPKAKSELAREHLDRALSDDDPVERVHWLFVALEAAIDSLAAEHGVPTGPSHPKRVQAAEALAQANVVKEEVAELLDRLNEARKDMEYEGGELDPEDWNLDDVTAEVESTVELAEGHEGQST